MKRLIYNLEGMWEFGYEQKIGVYFIAPNTNEKMVLLNEGTEDFDVEYDKNDNIFLVVRDLNNNLILFWSDGKSWNKKCVLEAKNKAEGPKNIKVICINGWINCFYSLINKDKNLLVHHIVNSENEPKVIDVLEDRDAPFLLLFDKQQNLHCFYNKGGLGCSQYIWSKKEWTPFAPWHKLDKKIVSISGIIGKNQKTHLCVCAGENKNFSVFYINDRSVTEIINFGFVNCQPVVIQDENLHILFDFGGRVLESISIDGGENFQKAKYFFPGSFTRLEKLSLILAEKYFKKSFYITEGYGYKDAMGNNFIAVIDNAIKKLAMKDNSNQDKQNELEIIQRELENIKKKLGEDNEFKMLFQLAKKLDMLENKVLSMEERLK